MPSTDRVYRHTDMNVTQGAILNRPELATAGRSQSTNSVPVKKTRTPATPRKEPVPRAPRGTKKAATATKPAASASRQPESSKAAATASSSRNPNDDLENITNGMKRIKINLITQSQKEARERSRAGQDASVASEDKLQVRSGDSTPMVSPTTLVSPTTMVSGTSSSIAEAIDTPFSDELPTPDIQNQRASAFTPSEDELGEMVTLPPLRQTTVDTWSSDKHGSTALAPSSPAVPHVEIQPSSDPADVFIPYQPEGPTPVPADSAESLKWLPPNVNTPAATPSPVKKQNHLFHYTPGSIPFAPRSEPIVKKEGIREEPEKTAGDE